MPFYEVYEEVLKDCEIPVGIQPINYQEPVKHFFFPNTNSKGIILVLE